MNLTPRLRLITSKIPSDTVVCDVGTDHAYIPVYLVKNHICRKVIATDLRKGPLLTALKNIRRNKLEEYIETRQGNGLTVLYPGEADTIIIAGMGGLLISNILENGCSVLQEDETIILQPMNAIELVRMYLAVNGYRIVDEELTAEGEKLYNVIVAVKGMEYMEDPIYYHIGKQLLGKKDPLLKTLLEKKINEMDKILLELSGKQGNTTESKRDECTLMKLKYKNMLKAL